jgi:hypothetical protein
MRELILAATVLAALAAPGRPVVKKLAAALLAVTALATASAQAATIHLYPNTCNNKEEGCTAVWIQGTIEPNDGGKFMELMLKDSPKKAVIILNSTGGNLEASLQIGRYVKFQNYATYVPSGAVCGSGCAMIWLAGSLKQVGENGKIGFHAAYEIKKVGKQVYVKEDGMANAIVGAYYTELGYSVDAIKFFTAAAPSSALFLNNEWAAKLGINVKVITDKKEEKKS